VGSPTERQPHTAFPPITVPSFTEDGRRLHRFRQSSLNSLDDCTEKARLIMSGEMPASSSDATAAGTAVHLGIELAVQSIIDDGVVLGLDAISEAAHAELDELIVEPGFQWVQMKEGAVRSFIDKALVRFYDDVLPTLKPVAAEATFGPLVLHEDSKRVIECTGTIDYIDEEGLKDWKTAGRPYEPWEKQRWAIQPTVYTLCAAKAQLIDMAPEIPFEYVVLIKGGTVGLQRITVTRHEGDWNWLIDKCVTIAELIEAQIPSWPKQDNTALCSPKFCGAWYRCKGKHYAEGWPKPSAPAGVSTAAAVDGASVVQTLFSEPNNGGSE
jgi:hypothetical protein